MKSAPVVLALVLVSSCVSDVTVRRDAREASAQPGATEESSAAPSAPMAPEAFDMEAAMAEMMRLSTPGPEHARLAEAVGSWEVSGQTWWDPSGAPEPMTATAETKTILGGRIVQEVFRMSYQGMPFEGLLLQGYDNLKGQYWSVWYDNMSTWGSYSTGNYNAAGELVLEGTMYDAVTPSGRLVRTVVTERDADHANMKMFNVGPGGEAQITMDLDYSRAR